ncbi:MAG TPA: hypothetical protein VJA26_00020, partial [Gammaproteobacteria bacterium]|nr:hypothetical protein [Gammaproteobacteria bacterium]
MVLGNAGVGRGKLRIARESLLEKRSRMFQITLDGEALQKGLADDVQPIRFGVLRTAPAESRRFGDRQLDLQRRTPKRIGCTSSAR